MEWIRPLNPLHSNLSGSLAVAPMGVAVVAVAAVRLDLVGIWALEATGARSTLFLSSEKLRL